MLLAIILIHVPAFTINAMTFNFLSLISPGSVMMFLESHRTVLICRSCLDLLDVFPSVSNFHSQILRITSKLLTRLQISQASENVC